MQRFHGDGCGESLRLEGLLGLVMRRHLDGFLGGVDQHFQKDVGHHQLLADGVETLSLLVVLKTPRWLDRFLGGDAVTIEVVEPGNYGGFKIGVVEVK